MSTTLTTRSSDTERFELAQRKAKVYASSTLVPKEYQGSIANVMIAMEMADRLGVNDLMCMQNVNIIHGRPSFSSQFLISCFNSSGRFSAIRYRMDKNKTRCVAYATELASGEIVEGTEVTLEMAKAEGWTTKAGSKWKTMPEHMLRWRAASFLVRQVAPEVGMGFHTSEEIQDVRARPTRAADVMARITGDALPELEVVDEIVVESLPENATWEDFIEGAGSTEELEQIEADILADISMEDVVRAGLLELIRDRLRVS